MFFEMFADIYIKNSVLGDFFRELRLNHQKRRWRKRNKNNKTKAVNLFDVDKVFVGIGTYGELNVIDYGECSKLYIGNYSSIGQNVTFILNGEHYVDHISSFPFKVQVIGEQSEAFSKGDIIIEDDVWIGYGSIIMSGVKIGQGAIIAAGAVVTKDIPPYAIVGGVPAKVIRFRFSKTIIEKLLQIDYTKLTDETIKVCINDLYEKVTEENIDKLLIGMKNTGVINQIE